jgi:hypothetical protein
MTDTATQVGTVDDCLHSIANRVETAKILSGMGEVKLLATLLEDIWRTVQDMCDEHCVIRTE